jgi:hypothetical protein
MIPVIQMLLSNPSSPVSLLSICGFLLVLIALGFFLGALGSLITLNRYIKF